MTARLSRRALLGAVCAAPVLSRHPGLDPGSTFPLSSGPPPPQGRWIPDQVRDDDKGQVRDDEVEESSAVLIWDRALARFQKAQAALAAAACTPDEALYDRLGARHDAALARLLRTPAPNLAVLALKLDLALDERAGEFAGHSAAMRALKRDARRVPSGSAPMAS